MDATQKKNEVALNNKAWFAAIPPLPGRLVVVVVDTRDTSDSAPMCDFVFFDVTAPTKTSHHRASPVRADKARGPSCRMAVVGRSKMAHLEPSPRAV